VCVGVGVGFRVGVAVGLGVGFDVGVNVGVDVGVAVGSGVGSRVGVGVGVMSSVGVGAFVCSVKNVLSVQVLPMQLHQSGRRSIYGNGRTFDTVRESSVSIS